MPSFDLKDCHEFWCQYMDPNVYRVICFMENSESWTPTENPELEEAITGLGLLMDDIDTLELPSPHRMIELLCSVKMSRMLRIMQAMDTATPGSAAKVIAHAEQNQNEDSSKLFVRRNIIFERLRLLSRVLNSERLTLLQRALAEDE